MSAFGRAKDSNDMPPMIRNPRSRKPKSVHSGAFMMTSDSELDDDDMRHRSYITSDPESKKRAIDSARDRQARIFQALGRQNTTQRYSSLPANNEIDSESESESDEQECDVPDEPPSSSRQSRPTSTKPPRRSATTGAPLPPKQNKKSAGGAQFQVPYGPIPLEEKFNRPSRIDTSSPAAQSCHNGGQNALSQIRSVQIRKNVKRMREDQSTSSSNQRSACGGADLDDLILDESTDRTMLSVCVADYLRSLRQNPYYRYAIAVAVASGHKSTPTYYISSESREILRVLDPTSNGSRQRYERNSSNTLRQLAETLRSAAYMLRNHAEGDEVFSADPEVKRQRVTARDLSSRSSNSRARDTANQLANSVLTDMASIHAEHKRLRDVLRNAHPSTHRQIYIDDKLTPFIDEAMDELYERGVGDNTTAHDLIMTNDRLMNLFARLTAQVINTTTIASGDRPTTQAHQMAVGTYKEKYIRNIVDYMRNNGMIDGMVGVSAYMPNWLNSSPSSVSMATRNFGPPMPQRKASSLAALLRRPRR